MTNIEYQAFINLQYIYFIFKYIYIHENEIMSNTIGWYITNTDTAFIL